MSQYTIYPSHNAQVDASDATFANALAGVVVTGGIFSSDDFSLGQVTRVQVVNFGPGPGQHDIHETFLQFSLAAIDLGNESISAVSLQMWPETRNWDGSDYTFEAYAYTYTPPLHGGYPGPADFVPASSFAALTRVATLLFSDTSTAAYAAWTEDGLAFVNAAIAAKGGTGTLGLVLATQRVTSSGSAVSNNSTEGIRFWSKDEAQVDERRPRLVIDTVSLAGFGQAGMAQKRRPLQPMQALDPQLGGYTRRVLPLPSGSAHVATPRPASGSIRTKRDGTI